MVHSASSESEVSALQSVCSYQSDDIEKDESWVAGKTIDIKKLKKIIKVKNAKKWQE